MNSVKSIREKLILGLAAVVLGISINSCMPKKVFSDNPMEKALLSQVDYEKYEGEKIIINTEEKSLKGGWGELELKPFILQPTVDFFEKQTNTGSLLELFNSSRQWVFKDATLEEIRQLFVKGGLSKETCDELLSNTKVIPDGSGYVTIPPDSVLWGFTSEIRSKLYPLIGEYKGNEMYSQPACYNSENAREWFYNSGFSNEMVNAILPLVYVQNGISYISDLHLILPVLKTDEERIALLQVMYRTRALDAYLKIREGEDVTQIADYWAGLNSSAGIKNLLQNLSNTSGGGEVSLEELLPIIPSSRLNTYSGLKEYETNFKDCHWTTINFFNNEPDERYYELPDLFLFMNEISEPTENASHKFGDIIYVYGEDDQLNHSCVYIADNLVLTKNGMGNLNPFIITYLDKTAPLYGGKIEYYTRTVADTNSMELE